MSSIEQLERLSALLEKGLITREEFDAQKAGILSSTPVAAAVSEPEPPSKPKEPGKSKPKESGKSKPKESEKYWTDGRIRLAAVGVIGILLLCLIVAASIDTTSTPPPKRGVSVKIVDVNVDDECTRVGDYCVRVQCTVKNTSSGGGQVGIIARLKSPGKQTFSQEQVAYINGGHQPGDVVTLAFSFFEADIGDDHTGECEALGL